MFNFNFICRPSKAGKKGLSPIELSIIINGERVYITLPLKVNAAEFKKKMASRRNNEILEYTSNVRTLLNKYCSNLMANGIGITAVTLKDYFNNGGSIKVYTLEDLYNEFMAYYYKKSEVNAVTPKSVRKYELALGKFIEYIGADTDITKIQPISIENFKLELLRTYESTSVAGILIKIKTAFIYAVNNGKLHVNPFNLVTIGKNTKEVEKLDDEDVEVIKRKAMIGRLDKVRDLFLFQCYTALSYCDMANLVQGDIQYNDGMYYVRKPRQKTGIVFFTVLNEDAMNILKKYDYQLPVLSNQKYNAYLKEVGDICGIQKELHTHLARHTAATRMLNNGIPIEVVAKVLGHSNTTMTQHYAKLLDKTVLNAFKKII